MIYVVTEIWYDHFKVVSVHRTQEGAELKRTEMSKGSRQLEYYVDGFPMEE